MSRKQLCVKRVYLPPDEVDGARILVDRLWPRGLARERAQIDLWLKAIAPSNELRRQYHGHSAAWEEFKAAYAVELTAPEVQPAIGTLLDRLAEGPVTLLFAARDEMRNNAVALLEWLEARTG